ncbi:MAG TPA: tRNA (adenosine(37)-N6)-dimethylallyltransferase MiaA [Longimicrobiales bacterium]|nr:tRNA (adenosine(37)-N6)-dimethylallyltransferase MiaA [Longimicrobiales bacterium]
MADDALVITGATATGKTAVAVEVAQRLGGEIISLDSRQVYRFMDIGTAKASEAERAGIPHHGLDIIDPDERFNAGRFAALARGWIADIRGRGRVPILAGGTGFFLRALTHPMFEEPRLDPAAKEAWKRYLSELPGDEVARWARTLDADAAARAGDRQRLARIVEVVMLTGRTLRSLQREAPPAAPPIDARVFVLDLPRDQLYRRIELRVDSMIRAGLAAEVRALMARGYDETAPGLNATGYIELLPHLRGERSLEEAVALIKAATRRYARRQTTWLRHQLPAGAVRLAADASVDALAGRIVQEWSQENP